MMLEKKQPKWMFIIFPGLAMLLGWGLRGHIGGGPFGAMIPGAMVALSICLLLQLSSKTTSIITVFAVVGIGLGGEMTYGQTLHFLRVSDTIWWGVLATTIKGGIWGFLGGIIISMGFIYKSLSKRNIILAFLLMMTGMILGFELINDPMIIYFSDRANPRSESWAALLFGAIAILWYLKYVTSGVDAKVVSRFSLYGLIGGALGFGIGGLWFVIGESVPQDFVFRSWWKMMEFTFGFLLGAFIGYAAWLSHKEGLINDISNNTEEENNRNKPYQEIGLVLCVAVLIFLMIPITLEPFVEAANSSDGFILTTLRVIARILVNYAFYGFILIMTLIYFPKAAWQIAITLTFCHTVIDLADDHLTDIVTILAVILIPTVLVAIASAYLRKKKNSISSLFLLLIWSTVLVSTIKIGFYPEKINLEGQSISEIILGIFVLDIIFLTAAIILTLIIMKRYNSIYKSM